VDFLGIVRNGKAFRPNDVIMIRKELATDVVKLPSNLNETGPIVHIGHWGIVIPG
jgi:hypothetical protein